MYIEMDICIIYLIKVFSLIIYQVSDFKGSLEQTGKEKDGYERNSFFISSPAR